VILEAIITPTGAGEAVNVYVDPSNGNLGSQTPYLTANESGVGPIIPPAGLYDVVISQFASATSSQVGAAIDHVTIADTFAEASGLPAPEPASAVLAGIGSVVGLLALRRRK
jgi:hypothetical protein